MSKQYQKQNNTLVDITPRVAAIVGRNVGELVHSIVPLVDANLHLLDGTELQDDGMYAAGIAKIKALQTSYPALFVSEADWQAAVVSKGVCGKFVAGSGTLRLPKITGFMEGTTDPTALGDLVEAGLPNITGDPNSYVGFDSREISPNGAFKNSSSNATMRFTTTSASSPSVSFDASLSNAIYGNSSTVQPQSIKGFFYIVLGTFPKASSVVNLDNIATDLNTKTTAEQAAHAAMPSNTFVTLSNPTASGQVIEMPADGYFSFYVVSSAVNGFVQLRRNNRIVLAQVAPGASQVVTGEISVSAGDRVQIAYNNVTLSGMILNFVYCNGNAHLAS